MHGIRRERFRSDRLDEALTGFLLAKETRPWYVYILLALVNCIISILVYAGTDALAAWLGG